MMQEFYDCSQPINFACLMPDRRRSDTSSHSLVNVPDLTQCNAVSDVLSIRTALVFILTRVLKKQLIKKMKSP